MNPTSLLCLFSAVCQTLAIGLLLRRKSTVPVSQSTYFPLLSALLLYDFIVISNFLEQSGYTAFFDPLEDVAEVVFAFLFLLFVNNWRKDRSEARFRDLFKLAPLPLAEMGLDGRIKEVNDLLAERLQAYFGTTTEEIQTVENWWSLAYPDKGQQTFSRSTWRRLVNHALETDGVIAPQEREVTCADGSKRWIIIGGRVVGHNVLISFFDITDRKRMEDEREIFRDRMLQSQKLEAIGTLAGGVAHDFNNMLGAIIGYSEMMLHDLKPEHEHYEDLHQILDAAKRSTGLTRQLLAFARKQESVATVFDVNQAIEDTLKMMQRLIGENVELSWMPGEGPLRVCLDPSQFDQILTNLCVNARDAIPDVGKITVETRQVSIGDDYLNSHPAGVPGEYALISFSDSGCGMDQETLGHIFEPFYTTKEVGHGTGLGLATVYGVIQQNRGMIDVYSEPGLGTTFNIYLPLLSEEETEAVAVAPKEEPRGRGESILIVEDNPSVLEMSVKMLGRLGYTVLKAATPSQALEVVEDENQEIDLLITDVVMPEMNGRDLAERVSRLRPGISVLFMSGYAANIVRLEKDLEIGRGFIKKPFSLRGLATKLREVLDSNAS